MTIKRDDAPSCGFESLGRDQVPVRSLRREDLADLVRIDRKITGRDRSDYYRHKLDEALEESAVRVSLVAERDGRPAGFIMARVDFGEYGVAEPRAVIDTIAVEPGAARQGVGKALLSQLLMNLGGLRVELAETQVQADDFELLRFFHGAGFRPSQQLVFRKRIG